MAISNTYGNYSTSIYAASWKFSNNQREHVPSVIDFFDELIQRTTKIVLGGTLGIASAVLEYQNRAEDGQITIRDALAVGMSIPGGILGGVVGVGTAQAIGVMSVAATGPVGLFAGIIIAGSVVAGAFILSSLVENIPNPTLDTVLWGTKTREIRDYHYIPGVDPINPYGYLQSMNYGDIGFTGYTGNNTGLDSPSEGQTMRPGNNPAPHTIADARAQERDYANSQGTSRTSLNPNDTYTPVLDDVANSGKPGWGVNVYSSGGFGVGSGGSTPAPRSPHSHSGWGNTHGGSNGGGSTGGLGQQRCRLGVTVHLIPVQVLVAGL